MLLDANQLTGYLKRHFDTPPAVQQSCCTKLALLLLLLG
jgi:hypothetical protein